MISGFDPFGFRGQIGETNPSGAVVLALDGRQISNGNIRAQIQGVIFPVRFADFDAGRVESFFRPFLRGRQRPDMIMTISEHPGSRAFQVEQFAGRRRSFRPGNFPARGNLGETGGVSTTTQIVEPPGLAPGPEFLETTLPVQEILGTPRSPGDFPIRHDISRQFGSGGIARVGSGGGFLSNEIFYRTRLLFEGTAGRPVRIGHLHTPGLAPPLAGITNVQFEERRTRIVNQVKRILEATLPSL